MGCMDSKEEAQTPIKANQIDKTSFYGRAQIIEAIRKNDIFLIQRVFKEKKTDPGLDLYSNNPGWNAFHECCQRKSLNALEFLIEHSHFIKAGRLIAQLNQKDSNGLTPAMICCLNDANENLAFLLKFNLINMKLTNKQGKTLENIALNYSEQCRNLIKEAKPQKKKFQSSETDVIKYLRIRSGKTGDALRTPQNKLEKIKRAFSQINERFRIYGILVEMNNGSETFVDDEFSSNTSSIGLKIESSNDSCDAIKWLRGSELYRDKFPTVKLYDRIAPEDVYLDLIRESTLGIGLQVLSEFPSRLMQCILNKEVNKQGAYSCKYYVMGMAAEVCSDDLYPSNEKGEPMFIQNKNGELWPTVIEKSAAKFYGSYQNTHYGLLDDLFEDILGVPCTNYNVKQLQLEVLYGLIKSFVKLNFITAVSSVNHMNPEKGVYKIQDGHYIIDAFEIEKSRFIKLRAPNGMFKGKNIQEQPNQKCKSFQPLLEENAFIIDAADIGEFFDVLSVAFYHEGWIKNYINLNSWKNHAEYVSLHVTKSTRLYIVVNQESLKLSNTKDYQYSEVEILLAKEDDKTLTKISSGDKAACYLGKSFHIDEKKMIELEEGRYIIRVKIPWKNQDQSDFTITTYSEEEVFLQHLQRNDYSDFLERLYISEGQSLQEKYNMTNEAYFANKWEGNHLFLYMQNNAKDMTWNLDIKFKKLRNIKFLKRYKLEDMCFKCSIPPNSQKVAILKGNKGQKPAVEWIFENSWTPSTPESKN